MYKPIACYAVVTESEVGTRYVLAFSNCVSFAIIYSRHFFCCLKAFGVDFSTLAVAILCTGIFLGSAVPASIGGFGSREIISVFLLASFGIQAEVAFLAAVLFGLIDVAQGIFALPLWLSRKSIKVISIR